MLNSANNDFLEETTTEILNIVEKSNIEVVKCVVKSLKHFKENYGGFIVISLGACSIITTIFFYIYQFFQIKLYIFDLTKKFISIVNTLQQNRVNNSGVRLAPPKNKMKKSQNLDDKTGTIEENKPKNVESESSKKKKKNKITIKNTLVGDLKDEKISTEKLFMDLKKLKSMQNKGIKIQKNRNQIDRMNTELETKEEININKEFFENYLMKPIEEMSFYDAYKYDKRAFCQTLCELILDRVMTVNILMKSEALRPFLLKIILYFLYINLYFIINGFFFSENYISEVYHLKKEEKFLSFIPRSINRLIYTFFVGAIIQFLINCFFSQENKLKRIFIRNKDNINEIKSEIVEFIKAMKNQLIAFFIIDALIFIVSFLYVISFNYVYHFTQFEWIKSTIFIYIVIELITTIICFLITCIRFISLWCRSDRLYKLSNIINRV